MKIEKQYKLAEGVANNDSRPLFQHVLISHFSNVVDHLRMEDDRQKEATEKAWREIVQWLGYTTSDYDDISQGLAICTDGFMMTIVPVELETDDVPGLVRGDVFLAKHQRRAAKKNYIDLRPATVKSEFHEDIDVIRVGDQLNSAWMFRLDGLTPDEKFPNLVFVLQAAFRAPGTTAAAYDIGLMRRVNKVTGITLAHIKSHPTEPTIITPASSAKLPMALIMPIHMRGSDGKYSVEEKYGSENQPSTSETKG